MSGGSRVPIDVLILTALRPELDAVLALGDGGTSGWSNEEDPGGLPYHVRSIARSNGRPLHLAVAWSTNMGEVAAADRASALARHLSPRWLAMCGICAGRRGEVSLGDVIVADRVFSYDHGKLIASTDPDGQRQEEIFRDITTYNLPDPWLTKVAYFVNDLSWSADLVARRPVSLEQQSQWMLRTLLAEQDPRSHPDRLTECPDWTRTLLRLKKRGLVDYPHAAVVLTEEGRAVALRERVESPDAPMRDPPFQVHLGPIATGKTVRVDDRIFDRLKQFSRKALGVEMEAAAIGYVAERLGMLSLVAKAVSDFADHDKDDGFRAFACQASARFVLSFFLNQDLDATASSGRTFYHAAHADVATAPPRSRTGYVGGDADITTLPGVNAPPRPAGFGPPTMVAGDADPRPPPRGTAAPDSRTVIGTDPPYVVTSPPPSTVIAPDPPSATLSSVAAPAMLERDSISVGTVLGSWRLVRRLGQGGMGTVYLAEHMSIGKTAAAKVLHRDLITRREVAERFLNEARAVARIKHPGVVDIYDYAIHDNGAAYIIMELLEGEELGDRIRRTRGLREPEAIAIAKAAADTLAAAHKLGIIHRDLKPGNVFLVNDPTLPAGQHRIKVLDFGIAKLTDWNDELNPQKTRVGVIMGTPSYMSPEQCRGMRNLDARSDQYSLGCMLFEMMSGRTPFVDDNPMSIIAAHMQSVPPRLGSLAPTSDALERIVTRLLAKQPGDRFASMDAVSHALSRIAGATIVAPPLSSPPPRVPRPSPMDPRTASASTGAGSSAPDGDALEAALPDYLQGDAPLIRRFLLQLAEDYEGIGDNALRLIDPRVSGAAGFEFFALLLSGAPGGGGGQLGTMTFVHHALPLEEHLGRLDRDARKVVIALSDSLELGRGVREKILDYRNRLDAFVVPIYLGELRKADRAGRLDALFIDRLVDFQTLPDLYAASGPLNDPTRFFGMRQVLDDLLAKLEDRERIVVIHGLPGSGKSSLVRMADYGMTAGRFVRLPCAAIAPPAMPAKIAGALGGSGDSAEAVQLAARAAQRGGADSKLVLVLEDADPWLREAIDPTSEGGIRELWDALIRLAGDGVMSTVATTVRGFALSRPVRNGLPNPLAKDVYCIEVPRLDRQTIERLVRDLGAQMNVTAAERVMVECAELSGGNVDVLRRLCSGMLKRHRRDAAHHALRAVELTRRDLQGTATDLVAMRGTFEGLLPWLTATEQRVLHGVAARRPERPGDLAAKDLPVADVSIALDDLRMMGLVERVDLRDQVTIPLLASWARQHLGAPGRGVSRWLAWMR